MTPGGDTPPARPTAAGASRPAPRRPAGAFRRWSLAAWLGLLLAAPSAAGLGLHGLYEYAENRRSVALRLERLGDDVNRATSDIGWALAAGEAASSAGPRFDTDRRLVEADVAAIGNGGLAGAGAVAQQSSTYMGALGDLTVLVGEGGIAGAVEQNAVALARTEHDALTAMLRAEISSATRDADRGEMTAEVGTWGAVVLLSAAVALVLWRAQAHRRRVDAERHAAVVEREHAFRMLFERNPLPMWTLDTGNLHFLTVNDAAVSAYGYSPAEFLEKSVFDLRVPDAPVRTASWLRGATALAGHDRHVVHDGRAIDVELVAEEITLGDRPVILMAARDITDQRRLETELRRRAFHDSLTGLANRSLFADRFAHAQRARRKSGTALAVLLLDLDGFKLVNDTLSHSVGDQVLRTVGERLQGVVRAQDTVARMGGDEFAVLLEEADPEGATIVGERLLDALREPVAAGGHQVDVSASAGLTLVGDGLVTWDTALQQADVAMYVAKACGKSCLRVYEPGMHSEVMSRLEISADMLPALARGEMTLAYQPVVATGDATDRVDRVEALVRWDHPARGRLGPACFIPIAEETGAIVDLGAWILATACRQAAAWRAAGHEMAVSVNVSARQLREDSFFSTVTAALDSASLPASALILEITETAILDDLEGGRRALDRLRALGARIALDDFGAGHSSLGRLAELPVDEVKIDRALLAGIEGAERRAMLLTVVRLLETLGVTTVAEGVETPAQLAYVSSLGIDAYQGFLFSPPLSASEVAELLRRSRETLPAATA